MTRTILLHATFFLLLILSAVPVCGQGPEKYTIALRTANSYFENGRFQEAIEVLEEVNVEGTRRQRADAYKLLAEIYQVTGNPTEANAAMLKLLKISPGTRIDPNNPDLYHLWRTFRTEPVLSFSIRGGLNQSRIFAYDNFSTGNTVSSSAVYNDFIFSFYGGLSFSVLLHRTFDIGLGLNFSDKKYKFRDNLNTASVSQPLIMSALSFTEQQRWVDIPLLFTYTYRKKDKFKGFFPYASVGLAYNYMLDAKLLNIRRTANEGIFNEAFIVEDDNFPLMSPTELRDRTNFAALAGAGVKFSLGINYLSVDFQYSVGFRNMVNTSARYSNSDLIYKFGYIDDDFRGDHVFAGVSVIRPIFVPKKKKRYRYILPADADQPSIIASSTGPEEGTVKFTEGEIKGKENEADKDFDETPDVKEKGGKTDDKETQAGTEKEPEGKKAKEKKADSRSKEIRNDRKKIKEEIKREIKEEIDYELDLIERSSKNRMRREARKIHRDIRNKTRRKINEKLKLPY